MVVLLIAAGWLASLALFVGLRVNATKARLERGDSMLLSAHGITARSEITARPTCKRDAAIAARAAYTRDTVPLGS